MIVSQKNDNDHPTVTSMNEHLKHIADVEKCEFEHISNKHAWNMKEKSDLMSFLYNMGFDRPLNIKRPIYDLVRILFCYEG